MNISAESRLLALTLALRQARSIVAKYERLTRILEDTPPSQEIFEVASSLNEEARQMLHQIDEALK